MVSTRLRRIFVACMAAGAMSLSAPSGAEAAEGPEVSTFKLPNGMEAVVIEDHRAPVVTHMVWYRVGAADEASGQSGVAHFLEHLLFKGTKKIAPGQFSKIIAENGGQDNAFTSYDYTAYFQRIAKDRLGLVMGMEADRMINLQLSEEEVATERDVVLEERSSRTDTSPQAKFFEQLNAALYLNHPYRSPVIGWRSEIEELSLENAMDFYKAFYGPDNAILIVAGDVKPEEVKALAIEHYGPIEPTGVGPQPRPQEPPQLAARRIAMSDAQVRQPLATRAYIAPSYTTAEPGQAEALALLAEILGGGATSRLHKSLVLSEEAAIDAGAYYRGVARDLTSFNWYAVPAEGVSLEALEEKVDAVIVKLAKEGPTEEELERAKMVMISSSIYQQDSQSSMARMYGAALTVGLTVEDVREWPDRMRALTAEDVRKAAAEMLKIEASVTGYLTGVSEEAPQEAAQ